MPCYKPLDGYKSAYATHKGNTRIVFNPAKAESHEIIPIPCGRCIGCRLEKSKEWALRCHHEASLYGDNNAFLTLTYSDKNLPEHSTLVKEHFQKFIRALRKKTKQKIRYYMCGEYGKPESEGGKERPHYHAIIFNFSFPDVKLVNIRNGNRVYTSPLLYEMWKHGSHEIGSVTFQSAGYVARYILKKQNGARGATAYEKKKRIAPYTQMSLKPGIGKKWYEKNNGDLFPHDFAVLPDGRQTAVPAYYRNLLKKDDPVLFEKLRQIRIEKALDNPDNSQERLEARERCQEAKLKQLKRIL